PTPWVLRLSTSRRGKEYPGKRSLLPRSPGAMVGGWHPPPPEPLYPSEKVPASRCPFRLCSARGRRRGRVCGPERWEKALRFCHRKARATTLRVPQETPG